MKRVQIKVEFIFRASPTILYNFLTTPSSLIRWFCDEVDITGPRYTFVWEGSEEVAILVEDEEQERLRFKWEEADDEDEFFEYKFTKSPVTGETLMEITDYCDDDEVSDTKQLWEAQMKQLKQETGG
ncbi:MAG: START-like domain-containing protein [Bacteroidota bacterium]